MTDHETERPMTATEVNECWEEHRKLQRNETFLFLLPYVRRIEKLLEAHAKDEK